MARDSSRALACALLGALLLFASGAHGLSGDGADGKYSKRTSSHFVLYQDVDIDRSSGLRGSRRFEQDVLASLERAYQQLDARLGLRPGRPITVVVHDPAIFDAQFSGLFRFPAAGFYGGRVHVRGGTVLDGQVEGTLYHELVHAAFDAALPNARVPAWLNEGLAEWFEARARGNRHLTVRQQEVLSNIVSAGQAFPLADLSGASFGGLHPHDAHIAYLQSYAFIEFLAREQGERRLREWVLGFLRTGDLERTSRRVYRAGLADLEVAHLEERRLDVRR